MIHRESQYSKDNKHVQLYSEGFAIAVSNTGECGGGGHGFAHGKIIVYMVVNSDKR